MDNLDTLTGAKLQEVLTSLDCVVEKNLQLEKDVLKFQEEILQVKKSNYDMRIQLDENRREVKNLQQCHDAISSVTKRSGIEKDSRHTTGHNEIEKLSRKVTDLAKRLDTLTSLLNEGMTRVDMNEERLERNLKVFNRIHVAGQNTLDLNKEVSTIWEQLDQINEVLDTYEEEKERKQRQRKHEQERRKLRQQQQKQSQQQQQQKPTQQQQRQQQTQSQQRQQPPQQQQKPTQQHQQQQRQTQPQQQQKQQPKRQPHQQQQQKQPPQQQQQTQSQQQQRQQQPQPQQPQQPKRQHQQQTQLHQCENPIQLEKLTLSEIRNQCNFCVQSNKNPQLVTGECVTVASWSLENHGRYVPYKDTQLEHYIYSKYFDLKTGHYQIPVGGRYKFFVATASYNSGNVKWFLTASNGEQRYLHTTTGWYKDIEVEWVCEKGIEIWLEAYKLDGDAIFWDCKYRGEFVGLEK